MSEAQTPARYNTSFFRSEHVGNSYACNVPKDFDFAKILEPSYWVHVAEMLRVWDRIEIRPDDDVYIAELIVVEVGREMTDHGPGRYFAKVALRAKDSLKGVAYKDLKVEWSGPGSKYRVLDGANILKTGFAKKKEAEAWVEQQKAA